MKTKILGNSGITVSQFCLGAMYLGSRLDRKASFEILDRFWSVGGNFVDTSNNYAFWIDGCNGDESESMLGNWMADRNNRNDIVIATKVGARPKVQGSGFEGSEGLSAQAIELAIEQSLRRLKTDRVDLYYSHIFDPKIPLDETIIALDRLVKKGKARAIGCSNHRAYQLERARNVSRSLGISEYVAVQQRHTFLRPKPYSEFVGGVQIAANEDLLHLCQHESGIALLAYSPLLGGLYDKICKLPNEYDSLDNDEDLLRLRTKAMEIGVTANQLVLAWMMNGRNKIIPVIAASNLHQLNENLQSDSIQLTEKEVREIGWWG